MPGAQTLGDKGGTNLARPRERGGSAGSGSARLPFGGEGMDVVVV